jgi:hypothetical protein
VCKIKIYKTLKGTVAKYRAGSWTMNKDIAKLLVATFAGKVLRRMFGRIKVIENWRRPYNEELMQVFGDLDILLLARISQFNWIACVKQNW